VREGQEATFTVDAYPDRLFRGTVRFISPSLRVDQRAMVIEAVVANPDVTLKLARAYALTGRYAESIETLESHLRRKPDEPRVAQALELLRTRVPS
jgi:multidrug efflux pump subunit AcrA (membrane-fusion protein)